jgi:hypothetical protein
MPSSARFCFRHLCFQFVTKEEKVLYVIIRHLLVMCIIILCLEIQMKEVNEEQYQFRFEHTFLIGELFWA